MKAQIAESALSGVGPDEVRQALDRLLWSKYFVNAHKKQIRCAVIATISVPMMSVKTTMNMRQRALAARTFSILPVPSNINLIFSESFPLLLTHFFSSHLTPSLFTRTK